MLVNVILKIYFFIAIVVITHELFHYVAAKLFRFQVVKVSLGIGVPIINGKKFSFTPILISGYVAIEEEQLFHKKEISVFAFFIAGVVANILLIILALFMVKSLSLLILLCINIGMIIYSLVPFSTDTDMGAYVEFHKKRQKMDKKYL